MFSAASRSAASRARDWPFRRFRFARSASASRAAFSSCPSELDFPLMSRGYRTQAAGSSKGLEWACIRPAILYLPLHAAGRCSSVVERTLGKGEADSSILSSGTTYPVDISVKSECSDFLNETEQSRISRELPREVGKYPGSTFSNCSASDVAAQALRLACPRHQRALCDVLNGLLELKHARDSGARSIEAADTLRRHLGPIDTCPTSTSTRNGF